MGAYLILGQSYCIAYCLQAVEFQGVDTYVLAYLLNHCRILLAAAVAIGLEIADFAAFQLFYAATGDKLHIGLRCREVKVCTAVDKRRTADADMYVLDTGLVEHLDLVAQLRASYDRVVAEHNVFALKYFAAGYELHLCNKVARLLVDRHKTA